MKHLLLFAILFIALYLPAQEINWLTNVEEAQAIAKAESKPILVYFTGSDWCPPCKLLKEDFFESAEFLEKAPEVILVMIDIPRRTDILSQEQREYNNEIVARYNPDRAFPTLVELNHKGKVLNEISAYSMLRDPGPYFTFLENALDKYKP